MRLGIRTKLLLGFAFVIVINAAVQFITLHELMHVLADKNGEILLEKAQNGVTQIQNFDTQNSILLLNVADHFAATYEPSTNKEVDVLADEISDTFRQNSHFQRLSIIDPVGKELVRHDRYTGVTEASKLNYIIPSPEFNNALQGLVTRSKVYTSEGTLTPQFDMYFPISYQNNTIGVIRAQVSLARLWDLIAEIRAGETGFAYVVDDEGRIIAHPEADIVATATRINTLPIFEFLTVPTTSGTTISNLTYPNIKNQRVVASGAKITSINWYVVVEQLETEALTQVTVLRYVIYSTLTATLILLTLVALVFASKVTASIRQLMVGTKSFEEGNLTTQVNIKSGDEIEDLANAFNRMVNLIADKIRILEEQKQRLEDDTHQLVVRDAKLDEINQKLEQERNAVIAERNKFAVILQGITDAVVAIDLGGQITIFNEAAVKLTGYSANLVIGQPIGDYFTLTSTAGEMILPKEYAPIRTDTFEGIVFNQQNVKLDTNLKITKFVNVITSKIAESVTADLACIITLHDVTDKHTLQEMQLDFVSMAAHELRTPLTSIRGYLEMLKENIWERTNTEEKSFLNRIEISALQLYGLMENLLSASNIERGVYTLDKKPTPWLDLIDAAVASAQPLANEKGLTIKWDKPTLTVPPVLVDPLRINEVLNNLISNAIKYTPKGEVTISVSIDREKNTVITNIKDTGQGIPADALPHMFEKFFRVWGTLEQGSKGTGLGLYITRAIVELHGGKMWVVSTEGVGSVFSFSLPYA